MTIALPPVRDPELQAVLDILVLAITDLRGLLFIGSGDPNTVVTASPPALYLNRAGGVGATVWYKSSGLATDTNWVALP